MRVLLCIRIAVEKFSVPTTRKQYKLFCCSRPYCWPSKRFSKYGLSALGVLRRSGRLARFFTVSKIDRFEVHLDALAPPGKVGSLWCARFTSENHTRNLPIIYLCSPQSTCRYCIAQLLARCASRGRSVNRKTSRWSGWKTESGSASNYCAIAQYVIRNFLTPYFNFTCKRRMEELCIVFGSSESIFIFLKFFF